LANGKAESKQSSMLLNLDVCKLQRHQSSKVIWRQTGVAMTLIISDNESRLYCYFFHRDVENAAFIGVDELDCVLHLIVHANRLQFISLKMNLLK